MKRLRFLFLTAVCAVFLSCGEDEDNQNYSVTSFAGYGGATATVDKVVATAGETVTLTATADEGFLFKEWKVRVGNTVIENKIANPAIFTMPAGDVVIIATFMIKNDVTERVTDPAMKAYCQSRMNAEQKIDGVSYAKWDTNGNGVLSPDEAAEIKAIDVTGGMNGVKIKSVEGLLEFTGLEVLKIGGNELSTLSIGWPKLTKLDCNHNKMSSLSVGRSKNLKELYCNNNHLFSLRLKTMLYGNGYILHCGNQTTALGDVQTVEVVFSDEQLTFWESNLKNLSENMSVQVKTIPASDVYVSIVSATVSKSNSNLILNLTEGTNRIQLNLKSLTTLSPGEYTINQMNVSSSSVRVGGGYRYLNTSDPGSFTVKYNADTKIYSIDGLLKLRAHSSYPAVNIVGFGYTGEIK